MATEPESIIDQRTREIFQKHRQDNYIYTDRLFVALMIIQWIGGIILAFLISPKAWEGQISQVHIHVWAAVFLGGLIAIFPIVLGIFNAGAPITRYVIAVAQMLFSGLLIHLTGGRIETHFHVFGSLAFLAFYRDWRVLIPATVVVAADHIVRGFMWPQSIYGTIVLNPWRWVEHAAWVVFEDIFLVIACIRNVREMKEMAKRTAQLEESNQAIEEKVFLRTTELVKSKQDLEVEVAERRRLEHAMVQTEKMAAVGQLAAGVAHEINNPVGFIGNNMEVLQEYLGNYAKLLRVVEKVKTKIDDGDVMQLKATIKELRELEEEVNLDFMSNDVNKLLEHSIKGLERIRKIVLDLRTFSREENSESMELIKVEEVMDSILSIVQNELKYKAELVKEYGDTPLFRGNAQRLGQVFINLLVNAAQAMEDRGKITIKTYQQDRYVCVEVVDTGKGIPEENLKKIFDPFFTTKPVGQGTGLGLSVSYEIIKKHGGEIKVNSKLMEGTRFIVMLPLTPSD